MNDTYSEEHRHACEVRVIASWMKGGKPDFDRMVAFFEAVERIRGKEQSERLKRDVRAEITKRRAVSA